MLRAGAQLLAISIPVWAWGVLVLLAVLLLFINSWVFWRKEVRRRFTEQLRSRIPGVEIVGEGLTHLQIRLNGNETTMSMQGLYSKLVQAKVRDESEEEKIVFDDMINALKDTAKEMVLDPQRDRNRIMARLQPPDFGSELQGKGTFPHRHLAELNLSVFYVMDAEHSVRYLDSEELAHLGLNDDEIFELAVENLRRITPRESVRSVLEKQTAVVFKSGDTMDAARLLTIPGYLEKDEVIAACIPDRDTLFLVAASESTDWDSLLAVAREGIPRHKLLSRPVRVTSGGFKLM